MEEAGSGLRALAPSLAVWVPSGSLSISQATLGRDALKAAGVRIYLVLPGNVLVTSASEQPPVSAVFNPLVTDRTWSTRANTVQSRSTALAELLLGGPSFPPEATPFRDEVLRVEDELQALQSALELELASTLSVVRARQIGAELAALATETMELTAVPIAGTPPDSRKKYLRGSILVHCLFVESTGTGNEDWNLTEVDQVLLAYADALVALARVAPAEYDLTFTLDHVPPTDSRMAISHEPSSGVGERTWIVQVLRNLGYSGVISASGGSHRLERDLIASQGVREATVVYVARDFVAPFAQFNASQTTAWPHAYFNGYAVMNSGVGGATLIHELMHTFNADDEYSDPTRSNYGCVASSNVGHDRAVAAGSGPDSNANQLDCHPADDHQDCLMTRSRLVSTPFSRPILCWHTRAQIGWRDTAAVRVQLAGLPSSTPGEYSPSLITHINGRSSPLSQTFSYMESGGLLYGGRRCTVQLSTQNRFTTTGNVNDCPSMSFRVGSVNGDPSDIRVNSPLDEGRVHTFNVPYVLTREEPCGNGTCDLTESNASCPVDCSCGNGTCDVDENLVSCPSDCAYCGDNACSPGETRFNCPEDCCTTCL